MRPCAGRYPPRVARALDALLRSWDGIAGPGAGAVENAGSIGWGLVGAVLAPRLSRPRARPGRGTAADVVLRLLALDLWGGAWCNNTPAAARWYHREGHGPRRRLLFCAAHLHPFVVAGLDGRRGGRSRWARAGVEYGYVLLAAVAVERVPRRARRAAGVLATAGGVVLDRALGPSPAAPWFAPVHCAKLLAGHAAGAALLPVDPLR